MQLYAERAVTATAVELMKVSAVHLRVSPLVMVRELVTFYLFVAHCSDRRPGTRHRLREFAMFSTNKPRLRIRELVRRSPRRESARASGASGKPILDHEKNTRGG